MRDKYDRIVTHAFNASKLFQKTIKEAFEEFMNKDASTAKYLAQHVNEMLGSGFKGLSEDDVEEALEKIIVLFRYLEDKDVYETYHKQYVNWGAWGVGWGEVGRSGEMRRRGGGGREEKGQMGGVRRVSTMDPL
jgi:hypothetical protein